MGKKRQHQEAVDGEQPASTIKPQLAGESTHNQKHKHDKTPGAKSPSAAASSKRQRIAVEAWEPSESELAPFACYFASGVPPGSVSLDTYEAGSLRKVHTLVGRKDNIDYLGSTYGGEYTGPTACSYALGVYDRDTGVLRVLPTTADRVVRLEPRLHSLDYGPPPQVPTEVDPAAADQERARRLERNKKLVDSFGSTRRRRQLTAREEGVVREEKLGNTSALANLMMAHTAAAAAAGTSKHQVMQRVSAPRHIPPHNPEATSPFEAYKDRELIPASIASVGVKQLMDASESAEVEEKITTRHFYHEYVLGRLSLVKGADRAVARRSARLLSFLSSLLRLRCARGNRTVVVDPAEPKQNLEAVAKRFFLLPEMLEALLELFYESSPDTEGGSSSATRYTCPPEKQTLLTAYVCVIALLAEGGVLPAAQFEALRTALGMKPADLVAHFKEVGGMVSAATISQAAAGGEGASPIKVSTYSVNLLSNLNKPNLTLRDCFPGLKLGRGRGK